MSSIPTGEVADVLEQAADLIETVGWIQGSEEQRDNGIVIGYCAIGAMRAVNCGILSATEHALGNWLWGLPNHVIIHRGVANWNDQPGRRAAEVIDAMKSCAKDLRNEAVPS